MNSVVLSLGTNLGDRNQNIQQMLTMLAKEMTIESLSPLYETEPVGVDSHEHYLKNRLLGAFFIFPTLPGQRADF